MGNTVNVSVGNSGAVAPIGGGGGGGTSVNVGGGPEEEEEEELGCLEKLGCMLCGG
tara:strand:+ start:1495 stop:1662 length:168 start_codon:yes stop_codon:yes gene_type:complete